MAMKSIAFFNNKGGVGKTTLLANVASYFQKKLNKKVLVVDGDPQCNLSIYSMTEEFIADTYNTNDPKTIYELLKPLRKGEGFLSWDRVPLVCSPGYGYKLLLGDTRMANMEDWLGKNWIDCTNGEHTGLTATLFIKHFLNQAKNHFDYVFVDVGPSLGAINRSILLACDMFIVPMSSDIFCIKAIDNIGDALKRWKKEMKDGLSKYPEKFDGNTFLLDGEEIGAGIKFLGYVTQQYISKSMGGTRRPVRAYDAILKKMEPCIEEILNDYYAEGLKGRLLLGEIPNFNSLVPLSQTMHKPIFSLNSRDGIVGAHFSKVEEYNETMANIVSRIKENTEVYYGLAE